MKTKFTWTRLRRKHVHMAISVAVLLLKDVCLYFSITGFGVKG